MAEWVIETTDDRIADSLAQAAHQGELPRIVEAVYHPERELDLFVLKISDGRRLVLPREELQALDGATPEQTANFTIEPLGSHLWWPQLDNGHHLSALLEHRYGNDRWMAHLARRGMAA